MISKPTTKDIFLGAPEAEAEALVDSRIHLLDVFDDYFSVLEELKTEKFIITGRKGSGKSAIAEYMALRHKNKATNFFAFIKGSDINFESILQLASGIADVSLNAPMLFQWVLLLNFCNMISENELLASDKAVKNLKNFILRNKDFLNFKGYEIKEILTTKKGEISVGLFKQALSGIVGRKITEKSERVVFYKLISHINDILFDLLKRDEIKQNKCSFTILIDDLDIGLSKSDENAMMRLGDLIRLSKKYNHDFGIKGLSAKIIILLRDDIANALRYSDADMSKTFDSYEVRLSWYNHKVFNADENLTAIKRFINKRLAVAFKNKKIEFDAKDPWATLISPELDRDETSSFKFLLFAAG